jgi:cation diffusion facilitator family transporter
MVLIFAALFKVGMFISIRKIARQVSSPTLRTTAQDNLNDVFTSLAAFVGAVGSSFIHPLLDPIAGILVALWIFRSAFNAAREHLNFLTGGGASEELRLKIIQTAESVPGVLRVHHLMTEYSGPRLVVDLHVNVNGDTPLRDSHEITDQVMAKLEALPDIDRVYVHLEPDDWTD